MFVYQKKLQYPVRIKNPNPMLAKIIISQYGGPDGELGASLRYLTQRYSMPYPELKGVLTDMVVCIKELLLDGKSVKIDDLAIFSVGLRGTSVDDPAAYSVAENVTGLRLRARATGSLSTTNLKLDSKLKHQDEYVKPGASDGGSTPTEPDEEDGGNQSMG